MGRDADYEVEIETAEAGWVLTCGTPLELDGSAFDYTGTPKARQIARGAFENGFCALFESADTQYELKEFDLGSADSPVLAWQRMYNLPDELFE